LSERILSAFAKAGTPSRQPAGQPRTRTACVPGTPHGGQRSIGRELLLIGHRGARRYAPENTIEAFELALDHGCNGIEFDVRCTADACAVICHDPRLKRLEVSRSTHSSLIERNSSLPVLEDVVEQFGSRTFLYIELKAGGLEEKVVRVLRDNPPDFGFVVASFLPEVVRDVHECTLGSGEGDGAPDHDCRGIPLGIICRDRNQLAHWHVLPVDYVMPHYPLVSRTLVEELHAGGKRVLVWTVNRERDMRRMAEFGVDGILSDDTLLLAQILRPEQETSPR
jgi:glycerophosphoryl diester phosphodiesterase